MAICPLVALAPQARDGKPVLGNCPVVVSVRNRQDNVLVGRHAKFSSLRVGRRESDAFIGDLFAARGVGRADVVGGRLRVVSHADFIATCRRGPRVGGGEGEMATVRPPLAPPTGGEHRLRPPPSIMDARSGRQRCLIDAERDLVKGR